MPEWSPRAGAHPDLETLATFADGKVSVREKNAIVAHLAGCEQCFEVVSELMAASGASGAGGVSEALHGSDAQGRSVAPRPSPLVPFTRRRGIVWGAAALAAAAAVVLAVRMQPQWFGRDTATETHQVAQLVAAVGSARYVEGRLVGDFPHGEYQGTRRSGSPGRDNLSLLAVAGQLQQAVQESPTARHLHAYGIAQLLLGEYDASVDNLEAALAGEPANARMLSDLSVAYYERAVRGGRPDDLPKAYEFAEQALESDARLVEPRFTRALALEQLGLTERAVAAWQDYLAVDSTSDWAGEARQRLARLQQPNPQARWHGIAESLVLGALSAEELAKATSEIRDVIPELWLEQLAVSPFAASVAIAVQFDAVTNDDSFLRATAALHASEPASGMSSLRSLSEGYRLLNDDRYVDAEPHLRAALTALERESPPLSAWARFGLARIRYFRGDLAGSLADLERVRDHARGDDAPALLARAHWIAGIVHFSRGDWSTSRNEYAEAMEHYESINDRQGAANVRINLSILARFLGDWRSVWVHRMAALQRIPHHRPALKHGFLVTTAVTASLQDLPRTALTFLDEAVKNATDTMPAYTRAETLLHRAKVLFRLGDHPAATRDLEQATQQWAQISDAAVSARVRLSLLTAGVELRQATQPEQAVSDAHEAVLLASERNDLLRSAELHLHLARAHAALEDHGRALESIERGLADFRTARTSLPLDDEARLSAAEPVWALFDEAVRLRIAQTPVDPDALFKAFEGTRAQTLRELRTDDPESLAQARQRIRDDQALILLHQEPNALRVWLLRRDSDELLTIPVGESQAHALIEAYEHRLSLGASTRDVAGQIADSILRPVLSRVRPGVSLVIVPDEPYSRLPWAALPNPTTAAPLVTTHAITVSPSVRMSLSRASSAGAPQSALVIAAPDASRELPVLVGARDEARRVAEIYAGAVVSDGARASVQEVFRQLPDFPVVHVAAHAVSNANYPLLSRLVLYPDRGNDGGLRVVDMLRSPGLLPGSVVVLAACGTMGLVTHRGEGPIGLAWGFLAAGAASVVATLWDVDDRAIASLFVDLHRGLASGKTASDALRAAQLAARERGAPEHVWAAVQVIGQP